MRLTLNQDAPFLCPFVISLDPIYLDLCS